MSINYKPNEQLLREYLKPQLVYKFPGLQPTSEQIANFNTQLFETIELLAIEVSLPLELVSDLYWIVTNYLNSFQFYIRLQPLADWNLQRNKDVLKILELYNNAMKSKQKVIISLQVGQKSCSIDDPQSVNFMIDKLKEWESRMDKESLEAMNFEKEIYAEGAKAISKYLEEKVGMNVKRQRAKLIAYIYSLAEIPFKSIVNGKKIPLRHTDKNWDEEGAIKTVLNYI